MLVSSASATTIGQHIATKEIVEMVKKYGDKLGGMLWVNPHDATWTEDIDWQRSHHFLRHKNPSGSRPLCRKSRIHWMLSLHVPGNTIGPS